VALSLGALLFFSIFVALGTWQVQRRAWKLDLIARFDERVHAPPVAAPSQAQWPRVTAANSEYLHVRAAGTLLNELETLVQAVTELGAGFWVLTPLRLADGSVILINRGFVPPERRERVDHGAGEATTPATVTGLLRMTERGGGFLRRNDPAGNRWYSRDVQAIAAARGLARVAPYFIDADAATGAGAEAGADGAVAGMAETAPVGGLTVITFHNSHLIYLITWYTLALMVVAGMWIVVREELRLRRGAGVAPGGSP
jgi:surfeit locus 1 family protein